MVSARCRYSKYEKEFNILMNIKECYRYIIATGGNQYGIINAKKHTGCWRNNRS